MADWCRAATPFVLSGGRAWMVTVSDGQANWIKQRLLAETSASSACSSSTRVRCAASSVCAPDLPPPRSVRKRCSSCCGCTPWRLPTPGSEWSSVARHPEACLAALDDFAGGRLARRIGRWTTCCPRRSATGCRNSARPASWTPDIDRRLAEIFTGTIPVEGRLSVCVFGWDANLAQFNLLLGCGARPPIPPTCYLPLPRGTSEIRSNSRGSKRARRVSASNAPIATTAASFRRNPPSPTGWKARRSRRRPRHPPAGAASADRGRYAGHRCPGVRPRGAMAGRRLPDRLPTSPAATRPAGDPLPGPHPDRGGGRAGARRRGIAVEDELGELPEAALAVQIQRAILDYHLDRAGLEPLLTIVELLNEHAAVWDGGTGGCVARRLPAGPRGGPARSCTARSRRCSTTARALAQRRRFVRADPGGETPASIDRTARRMAGIFAVDRRAGAVGRSRSLGSDHRSAGAALVAVGPRCPCRSRCRPRRFFIISTRCWAACPSGAIPTRATVSPGSSSPRWKARRARPGAARCCSIPTRARGRCIRRKIRFSSDASRTFLNARRAGMAPQETDPGAFRGHLLTASDRAQLEHFHFLEVLQNCRGPLAFAAPAATRLIPTRSFTRTNGCCAVWWKPGEPRATPGDCWTAGGARSGRRASRLPSSAKRGRRICAKSGTGGAIPKRRFDEYFFNFIALTGPDELPWADAWSAGELDAAWNRPATFALGKSSRPNPGEWTTTAAWCAAKAGWWADSSTAGCDTALGRRPGAAPVDGAPTGVRALTQGLPARPRRGPSPACAPGSASARCAAPAMPRRRPCRSGGRACCARPPGRPGVGKPGGNGGEPAGRSPLAEPEPEIPRRTRHGRRSPAAAGAMRRGATRPARFSQAGRSAN